jgi:hypothetical protein
MSKQEFCVNTVVAKLLKDYVQTPNYEELREKIVKHKYAQLKLSGDKIPFWYALLHLTSDCAIVQDVLLRVGGTRFSTHVVKFADWEDVFVEWIDKDDYWNCHYEFQNGMRSWGADI